MKNVVAIEHGVRVVTPKRRVFSSVNWKVRIYSYDICTSL